MMTSINPYALLGVTIDSTPKEARTSYYHLALLMHPDKGGNAADMHMLHTAYLYVIEQLEGVNRTRTFEDLDKAFREFCLNDEKAMSDYQRMCDFPEEIERRAQFESWWNLRITENPDCGPTVWRGTWEKGYGDKMMPSEPVEEYKEDIEAGPVIDFETRIITYTPPSEWEADHAWSAVPYLAESITDFSTKSACDLSMADYMDAFAVKKFEFLMPPSMTYEEMLAERELLLTSQKLDKRLVE